MKAKRLTSILAAFACVLLVLVFQAVFTSEIEHARSEGERLSIAGLRENEEIVVSLLFEHRTARGREYRIRREGVRRTIAIFDTTPERPEGAKEEEAILSMRDLSEAEIEGLDETIAYCREVREEESSATRHMGLRCFRDGKRIGEEFYIGFSLPSQLAWYERQGMRGHPEYAHDYTRLAVQFGVSVERIYRMISFEMLEKEETNQALQLNASSRALSDDSSASETPSSVGPRG